MEAFNPKPALGMTPDSTNEEITATAFDFILETGYMAISTISVDGATPNARNLELHRLDASGLLYVGMARGKPVCRELERRPFLVGSIARDTAQGLSAAVRLSAHVTPVDPEQEPGIYARYWALNPGTKSLYRKDLSMFRIFRLDAGDGEIFHLPEADQVRRVRFSFGGAHPRPWAYEIGEGCTGCGVCAEGCMESVIHPDKGGKYAIDHFACLECGRCFFLCPSGAIACHC